MLHSGCFPVLFYALGAGTFVVTCCLGQEQSRPADMVLVTGGSFLMGDVFEDQDSEADEKPAHRVSLDDFYLARFAVTVGEFREFVEATGYKTTAERDGGARIYKDGEMVHDSTACWSNVNFEQHDRHPVVCVSWYDAVAYCNWRSGSEGLTPCYSGAGDETVCDFGANGYRLPTEAEWEFAARSRGKNNKYGWGNGKPYINGAKAANIRDEAARRAWGAEHVKTYCQGYDDGFAFTSPVGTFAPNELGLYDISGNVYEWCWDWYGADYFESSSENNPRGADSGEFRSCRNVGYGCPASAQRTVNRGKAEPAFRFLHGGFRVARSAD